MGRMAELALEREQIEREITVAKMEAAQDALPMSFAESLEIVKMLRSQLGRLASEFEKANSSRERNKERAIGFGLGVVASLIAALLWWIAASHWVALKS